MQEILRIELPLQHTSPLHTLTWMGDELVDWASGGKRFRLDRTVVTPQRTSSYHFDAALVSPDAKYIALYERSGTKGLLLAKSGEILREINRSYYHATDVEDNKRSLLEPDMLAIYDIERKQILHRVFLEEPVGTLMPLGEYVVGFYQHPKLIELKTGKIIMRWEDIFSGEQNSSILSSQMNLPPLAIDRERKRFAVASKESIIVVQLG